MLTCIMFVLVCQRVLFSPFVTRNYNYVDNLQRDVASLVRVGVSVSTCLTSLELLLSKTSTCNASNQLPKADFHGETCHTWLVSVTCWICGCGTTTCSEFQWCELGKPYQCHYWWLYAKMHALRSSEADSGEIFSNGAMEILQPCSHPRTNTE